MVSKKSIKRAVQSLEQWDKANPHASIITRIKRSGQYLKDVSEIRISPGTLPSIIAPIPKSAVDKIDKRLKMK